MKGKIGKVAVLLTGLMLLIGCGAKEVEDSEKGQKDAETIVQGQTETLDGSIWFSQKQNIEALSHAAGFIGWVEGVALTEDYVYYLYRTTNDFEKELTLNRVPIHKIFTEDITTGYYPSVLPVEVTEVLPLPTKIKMSEKPSEYYLRFFADEKEQLYLLSTTLEEDIAMRRQFLYRCDADGQILKKVDVTEILGDIVPEELYSTSHSLDTHDSAVDAEGNIYLARHDTGSLWILNEAMQLLHKVELPEKELQQMRTLGDGKVYMVTGEGESSQLWRIDAESGEVKMLMNLPDTKGKGYLLSGETDTILYGDQAFLYECNVEEQSTQTILTWAEHEVSGKNLLLARKTTDGRYYALEDDHNLAMLEQVDGSLLPAKKKQVELGIVGEANYYLNGAVVEFNKRNAYYEVILKEYAYEDGQQILENELATGKGPDFFDIGSVYVEKLTKKGMLADLSPYLEDGKGIEREDLVDVVLRCNTMDGMLTCVPYCFSVDILRTKKEYIGNEKSWSVEEFLSCLKKYEGIQVVEGTTHNTSDAGNQYTILYTILMADVEHFIDEENNKALFDSEEFMELLSFAKGYQTKPYEYDIWEEADIQIQEGKVLLNNSGIGSLETYMLANAALQQEAQYIGNPSFDGSVTYGISNGLAFGVNADSQLKEGAWAFIEFMMTYRLEDGLYNIGGGFPVRKAALEYELLTSTYKKYEKDAMYDVLLDENGMPVEAAKWILRDSNGSIVAQAYAATQEDIDAVWEIINGATYVTDNYSNTIYRIVEEEIIACLTGERSVEETAQIIQNRVQLYLDEQN